MTHLFLMPSDISRRLGDNSLPLRLFSDAFPDPKMRVHCPTAPIYLSYFNIGTNMSPHIIYTYHKLVLLGLKALPSFHEAVPLVGNLITRRGALRESSCRVTHIKIRCPSRRKREREREREQRSLKEQRKL
jgi:hypothetical protein